MNAPAPALSRPRLPALTGLRFFAALHVVIFHLHVTKIALATGPLAKLASIGYTGVSLFFVLSGFILVYVYAERPVTRRRFWRARFARVYPAYAFSLLLTAPIFFVALSKLDSPLLAFARDHTALVGLLVLTLLQAWIPAAALSWNLVAWSLSAEAFFYLVFPFLLPLLLRRGRGALAILIGACWLASLGLSAAYLHWNPDNAAVAHVDEALDDWLNFLRFNPLVRLPEFLLGMAAGLLFVRGPQRPGLALPLVSIAILGFVTVVHFSPAIPYLVLHNGLMSPLFAALIFGLALRPSWSGFLGSRLLVLLGDASYSLYLLHATLLALIYLGMGKDLRTSGPLAIALPVVFVVGLSVLVYRYIEAPARRRLNPAA